ncbi:MAG: hypothetical protein HZB55_10080, partial [Deltaproteobacteria bacterium]|nr:hypothetical protein [Deltaproteobacteria bacterium]
MRVRHLVFGAAAGLLCLASMPPAAVATHFPDGSLCYDCHAISKLKMVPGTHLIRASQRTTDLGITQVSPTMRCLFCHDTNAVSAALT